MTDENLYERIAKYVLDEISLGTPLKDLKETIAGLVADGYLQHKDVATVVKVYKKKVSERTPFLKDIYESLKEGFEFDANLREATYIDMRRIQDKLKEYTYLNQNIRRIQKLNKYISINDLTYPLSTNPGSAA